MGGWVVGIGNKAQLSPVIAGAWAWTELGNNYFVFEFLGRSN